MSDFNLIDQRWIPLCHRGGPVRMSTPWEITGYADNPWTGIDAPRPDFKAAVIQFLISLVQTACPPPDDRQWRKWFVSPPAPEELKQAFGAVRHAFNLFGEPPLFLQETGLDGKKERMIDRLLLDSAGDQTIRHNTDHFIKRSKATAFCRTCAASALLTAQINSPAGGRGFRTSVRGGGPLTTIAAGDTLWKTIWMNIIPSERANAPVTEANPNVFPWMRNAAPDDRKLVPPCEHDPHVFWAMPRRIQLLTHDSSAACGICGGSGVVSTFRTLASGLNYGDGWRHPLSPYRSIKDGNLLCLKGRQDALTYRNWPAYCGGDAEKKIQPALVLHDLLRKRGRQMEELSRPRIWAFGYQVDNAKIEGWYEGLMPVYDVPEEHRADFMDAVLRLVRAAEHAADELSRQVKRTIFVPRTAPDIWHVTEAEFYRTCDAVMTHLDDQAALRTAWAKYLRRTVLDVFDSMTQARAFRGLNMKKVFGARSRLGSAVNPYAKKMRNILDLPTMETRYTK